MLAGLRLAVGTVAVFYRSSELRSEDVSILRRSLVAIAVTSSAIVIDELHKLFRPRPPEAADDAGRLARRSR